MNLQKKIAIVSGCTIVALIIITYFFTSSKIYLKILNQLNKRETVQTNFDETINIADSEIITYFHVKSTQNEKYPEGWLDEFNEKITELQKEFPNGMYWNHMGSNEDTNGVTNIPCDHNINFEKYCNSYHGNSDDAYDIKMSCVQCLGFASMLSDRIFGTDAPAIKFYNYDEIRVGDQARINGDTHTVFIIDKTDEYVVVAECNADYVTCKISWGRKIPREELIGFYITRWD